MIDKHINEVHNDLTIIARSTKKSNGYLYYYWTKCKCGNVKRYRYDQARRVGNCGSCEDYIKSNVNKKLEELRGGKE